MCNVQLAICGLSWVMLCLFLREVPCVKNEHNMATACSCRTAMGTPKPSSGPHSGRCGSSVPPIAHSSDSVKHHCAPSFSLSHSLVYA
jgi:hypothetical protein